MADKPRIYVDSACYIDAAKDSIGLAPPERKADVWYLKQLMEAHKAKEIVLFTSVLTVSECTHVGPNSPRNIQELFTRLLTSGQYVTLIQPTVFIAMDGRALRWNHAINLSGADSLHVASGLFKNCDEFLTTDEKLGKFAPSITELGMKVLAPSKTNLLPAAYLQGSLLDEKVVHLKKAAK